MKKNSFWPWKSTTYTSPFFSLLSTRDVVTTFTASSFVFHWFPSDQIKSAKIQVSPMKIEKHCAYANLCARKRSNRIAFLTEFAWTWAYWPMVLWGFGWWLYHSIKQLEKKWSDILYVLHFRSNYRSFYTVIYQLTHHAPSIHHTFDVIHLWRVKCQWAEMVATFDLIAYPGC